jgi:lactate racemase
LTPAAAGQMLRLRTAAWYGDRVLELPIRAGWEVETHWPATPPPLSDAQLREHLERPVGQPPISRLAQGRRRPVIMIDDLTRPTPAARLVPLVLSQLAEAGIAAGEVTVVLAKGSHGPVQPDVWARKIGAGAAASCRLHVHEYDRDLVRVGRTSFGTPVHVNRAVAASDLLIGIGGIYPQHSTGFGGGSKLVLGVLGRRSIVGLHYGHPSMDGSYQFENAFRRDLDEIAQMVGLRTVLSVHVDANREIVHLLNGDHLAYYRAGVEFSRLAFSAPMPGPADVVISNAYPIDVSLTFMRSKGLSPLFHASAQASRIVISANSEGIGLHRLFPFLNAPRWDRQRQVLRKLQARPPLEVARKLAGRVNRPPAEAADGAGRSSDTPARPSPGRPILLYSTTGPVGDMPRRCRLWADSPDEIVAVDDWADVQRVIEAEQGGRAGLRVAVYPCASIQVLDPEHEPPPDTDGGLSAPALSAGRVR